jgi:hypothetical protein
MMPLAIRRAAHWTSPFTALLLTLSLSIPPDRAFAAAVGDQVELSATHPAGVPSTALLASARGCRGCRTAPWPP